MPNGSDAFATFFDDNYAPVFRCVSVAFREPLLAEEATREAFTRVYTRWSRVRRAERPETWLYVAASRAAIRRGRANRGAGAPASEPDTLEQAIEELTARERLALVLHHHAGLSARELARALRGSSAAATATLRDAHRRLGVERDDDDDIPEVELDAP